MPRGFNLAQDGITAYAPLLAGRGTSARDMAKTGWRDWVKSAEDAYIINNEEEAAFDMSVISVYTLFPITSLRSLDELMRLTREELRLVEEPVLVVQSINDNTVDATGPGYVMEQAASKDKQVVWIGRSRHLLTLDTGKDIVLAKTLEFIRNHLKYHMLWSRTSYPQIIVFSSLQALHFVLYNFAMGQNAAGQSAAR